MTLPVGVLKVNLTFGVPLDDAGTPVERARVTILAAIDRVWAATGDLVLARNIVVELDAPKVVPLAATDQPGFVDRAGQPVTNWTLDAIIDVPGRARQLITFALPAGGIDGLVVDFDRLVPVAQSDGQVVAVTVVTSVNGKPGAVTVVETPRPANTYGVLGDSITANGWLIGPTFTSTNTKGYWAWASVALRHRLKLVRAAGVSGDSTAQMLARVPDYLTGGAPGWSFVLGGTNDAAGLVPVATTASNLTAIYDAIESAGGRVVAVTIPPRTGASAAINLRIAEVNRWVKQQAAARRGLIVVDVYPELVSATSGDYAAGMTYDNVHPSPQGAAAMGRTVAAALEGLIPRLDVLPYGAVDTANLITNPFLNGTGGVVGTGGTGTVAAGWQVNPIDGVASVFTCSKVARTDGIPGEWQQVAVTSGQVKVNFNVTGFGTVYNTGDLVYAVCEFETNADLVSALGAYFRLKLAATKPDFGDGFAGYDLDTNADTLSAPAAYIPRAGVLVTEPIAVPATATLRLALEVQRKGAGTVRVGRSGIYKVGSGPVW